MRDLVLLLLNIHIYVVRSPPANVLHEQHVTAG